ncbi:non-ribosomal peptide synthase/polyketide synthase [Pseudomonas alkylphenolica]|uniref:Non-ribosomal peptide synthetase PvdD n=1 Tax=Pseudomonas alkylphenolica TaxID=237609 RepID=A0A077F9D1_9PSED|nr:non-ribosomal peptide synthetase [Pseudomonas alkylphenolica]AIL61090.1 non-ribosomal peptide synthetase PvdD [Pseudomonas alkylphenolica]
MRNEEQLALVQRFVRLPLAQRKAFLEKLGAKGMSLAQLPIAPVSEGVQSLPLSYAQQRQWFLWKYEPASPAYHIPVALRLRGPLNFDALQAAFNDLVARHAALRTRFVEQQGHALQVIEAQAEVAIERSEGGFDDALDQPQALAAFIEGQTRRLFDLASGPLLRVHLRTLGADDHLLVLTVHHIVADGASMPVMVRELSACYEARSQGQSATLPALPVQYADYALWQRSWMEAGEQQRQLAYWCEQLQGDQPVLELPLDRARPLSRDGRGDSRQVQLPLELLSALRQLAQRQGVSLFVLMMAAFQTLLHRYSGQQEICVGVPFANRNRVETQGLVGFFVNTQILRGRFDSRARFTDVLAQMGQTAIEAQRYQDLPFDLLVEALQPERSTRHNPLFQVMFNYQHDQAAGASGRRFSGLGIEGVQWQNRSAQFDLSLDIVEAEQSLTSSFIFATDVFEAATIERMMQHWQTMLWAIVDRPQRSIGELPMVSAAQQQVIVQGLNPTVASHASQVCLHEQIAAQAARTPQAVALVFEGQQLSYAQLNARANRLAHRLIAAGVGPESRVGLAAERSLELVVGLLAILKAGSAYVPLDPMYPAQRLEYMIQDSGISLLLSQPGLRLPAFDGPCLSLDEDLQGFSDADPQVSMTPDNLAYIIYTSGSTGQPKGALLSHHNVQRLFAATGQWFSFDSRDTWTLFHSYAFDFSVWEIFGALLHGGRLVIVPYLVSRSPEDFHQLLIDEQVTVLNQTPSAFRQLMHVACADSREHSLRAVVFGGEALDVQGLRPWFERFGDAPTRLINMYGITETTVHVTYRPLSWADLDSGAASPIGLPIPDLSWYVLDAELNPVPAGCVGELYVGRAGLARGYLNRGDLSGARFIPDPFGADGGRLYRTGDLARYCADGAVEYIGRLDQQVKIRGFRIELGEIEARLQAMPQVREAVVLAEDGRLLAYVVPTAEEAGLREMLQAQLKADLPDYMVPAHWQFLSVLPLTANGKLDRKALPRPDAAQSQQTYVAPVGEIEKQIAAIWQEVLGVEQVGVNDNFFELGGDSIVSIQVVSRARQAGIRFTPKDLFQHQTVQGLASVAQTGEAAQIVQAAAEGELMLLPIQQQFFQDVVASRHHFNQSVLLQARETLQVPALETALAALWAHHDALRLRFSEERDGWRGRYSDAAAPSDLLWQVTVADAQALEAEGELAQRSLDLSAGPLLRAVLMNLADGSQRLLLVIHHLAVDGVSWRILLEDLHSAYEQACAGQQPLLPARTSSVKAWAERLQQYAREGALAEELVYWREQLHGVVNDWPQCNSQGSLDKRHAASVDTRLDAQATRQLLKEAPAAYRTQVNDLLLTALARVIGQWTGNPHTLLQLEGHGREDLFEDIDLTRTVGWFTSLFPLRLSVCDDLRSSILQVKEQLRALPNKGLGYGVLRHLGNAEQQAALQGMAQGRITFNYLGQFDSSFDAHSNALLRPATEARGSEIGSAAQLANWLSINGQVYGGELTLSWTFSREMFAEATVQALADAFALELRALIAHCCDPAQGGVSPSDFALARLPQTTLDTLPVPAREIDDLYPLSPMQQGMLFHSLYEQAGGDYINQVRVDIHGLDPQRFQQAWQAAVDRHDILRTGFVWEGLEQPLQVVRKQASVAFELIEAPGLGETELDSLAQAHKHGFDLGRDALLRLLLVRTGEHTHHLIYTHHHILMDGWSNAQLLGEVLQHYHGHGLSSTTGRYRDYLAWLQQRDGEAARSFWQSQLNTLDEPVRLAEALLPETLGEGQGDQVHQASDALFQRLQLFARQTRVTLNTVLQGAWLLLLQRYSGKSTVAFGATVAGRPTELNGIERQIGLFINTLPIIESPSAELRLGTWLERLQNLNLALREYEHTPLADLQRWAGFNGQPLFDTNLVFENYPVSQALSASEGTPVSFSGLRSHEQSSFPLTLIVTCDDALRLHLRYQRGLFSETQIATLMVNLEQLLDSLVHASVDTPLGELDMLGDRRQDSLRALNPAVVSHASHVCLHEQIAAQAARTPQAVALVFEGQHLSYAQLNARANRLAHRLIGAGVGPESRVGLAAERSLELVVGLLAILKAGGAYVPLDPMYPAQRLEYMIQDSGISLLLSQPGLNLPVFDGPCLHLDEDLQGYSDANPQVSMSPDNLAYIIYTSGSTGQPKGALLSHHNVQRLFAATGQWFSFDSRDTWTLFHSYAFDFSVWEIFGALLHGGRLVVVPYLVSRSPEDFHQLLIDEQVTVLNQTPSAFRQLMHVACAEAREHSLRAVVFGGEALDVQGLRPWFERFGDAPTRLINMYGITETTVHVTYRPLSWADLDSGAASPIGLPIPDLSWYVLDAELNPVPAGCVGELYVGRAGLARGYLNRGDLSGARFIPDPFGAEGGRLYRTGDLARYCADGAVEYIGRLDQQVKIRGFRIELGEIEARLQAMPQVREAVVLAEDGRLLAYVVPRVEQDGLREVLQAQLKADLPEYMVPAHWQFLSVLPLTANGKLDRKALPRPDAAQSQQAYVAPVGEIEKQIAAIWQEVLGVEQVGVNDNFFELGGDSIVSIQVVSRARQAGIRFTPKDLFQHQTVQGLASVAQTGEAAQIVQAAAEGELVLLPIQQQFFQDVVASRHHFNQSVLLQARETLQVPALETALAALWAHHDALRLRFSEEHDGWRGRYSDAAAPSDLLWQVTVADAQALEAEGELAQRSLDLSAGPLLRAVLMNLADGSQRLLLVIHHLAVDGVSWRILLEDLHSAYEQACAGQQPLLPARTSSVKAWAERLQQYAREGALQEELGYWQSQVQDIDTTLPCDAPDAGLQIRHAGSVHSRLDARLTGQLLQDAPAAYRTQVNDLLLTALARVIARWTGRDEVMVQLEGHGREDLFEDIDLTRTVGWFTSLFPLRLSVAEDLPGSILQVKERLRAVPNKGVGYGVLRHLGSTEQQALLSRMPQPRITFNYLGQFDASFQGQTGAFLPAAEAHGLEVGEDAPLGNWLSVNGQVYGGELSLSWTFSREMFAEATVQALADAFALELRALIAHCCDPAQGGVSPSDFPLAQLSQATLHKLPVPARQIDDLYPLSPMQQGMLFHSLYDQAGGDYINQVRLDIHGLDPQRFEQAWQAALDRHDILRTGFVWEGLEQPLQVVRKQVKVPLRLLDGRPEAALEQYLDRVAQDELNAGFDLAAAPLLRLVLVRNGEGSWHVIYTNHHILMDGWSNARLLGEVLQRYAGDAPPRHPGRYRDYIGWLAAPDVEQDRRFWQAELADLAEPALLVAAVGAGATGDSGYDERHLRLSVEQTAQLAECARALKITVNTLVQGAWAILLQRYLGRDQVVFGATVAGRPTELQGVEEQIGLFINTLPVRFEHTGSTPVQQGLRELQARNLSLREHEHSPLFDIQRWAGQGGEALFDTLMVFENYPVSQALAAGTPSGLRFGEVANREQSHYPLTLVVGLSDQLSVEMRYDRGCFAPGVMDNLVCHLGNLLLSMVRADARTLIGQLDLLGDQRTELIAAMNPAVVSHSTHACLHEQIATQAARTPQAVALVYEGQRLSYAQLNARANRLAHRLIAAGVGPESRVGLAAERSLELVVGLLAILKAGGAYVPLDPMYPAQRLEYMIQDSGISLLLSQPGLNLPVFDGPCLHLDEDLQDYSDADPQVSMSPDNLAYIIYTSGSTGQPKGALLSHHNVQRLFAATGQWFSFDSSDTWTLFHSYAFDFSVWEIFGALLHGGRLVIVPYLVSRSPEDFHQLLIDEQVTVLNQTPSAFRQLMHVACADPREHSLRAVVFGGEALDVQGLRPWFERFGDAPTRLINMYGITETTVHVTYRPLSWADLDSGAASPIGLPIPDLSWYVLDAELNPVPAGCVGELYVGRAGLARGYLNRGDLSGARFIPDPFGAEGGRLYRTGDLARYCADGAVEYIGRLDQQVKIRGFRIELGEIEARLQAMEQVREAVVLAEDGRLLAYVVPSAEQDGLREILQAQLKADLPDYMVPAHWQFLSVLPLTANGKLDRKALPRPDAAQSQQAYVAPVGEIEKQIAAIWQEVLGVEQVGGNDNFFELGGHSLLATQVVARCRDCLPVQVQLRDLFSHPQLADLAAHLNAQRAPLASRYPRLQRQTFVGEAPLSLAQRRLWVVEQLSGAGAAYGMPLALRLHGDLSTEHLMRSLTLIVARHDVLRTAYLQNDDGDPVALIHPQIELNVPLVDLSMLSRAQQEHQVAEDALANACLAIDLEQAPLWRARILRLSADEHVLLFSMHHIISDGWSMGVLVNELVTLYAQLQQGQAPQLAPLPIQYADYACWQVQLQDSGVLGQQADFWRTTLDGCSGQLALPGDFPRPVRASQEGGLVSFELSAPLSRRITAMARQAGVTPYVALLTAFSMFLHRVCGSDDLVIGADIAGRHQPELEGLIGFFVNVLPLRSQFPASSSYRERMARLQAITLDALEHQDLPFDQIVEAAAAPRLPGMNPLVQVLFVMNNLPSRASSLSGIRVEELPLTQVHSKFDMALFMSEQGECLSGVWQYAASLFKQETIESFVKAWIAILEQITADQAATVGDIDMALASSAVPPANPGKKDKVDKLGKFLKKAASPARSASTSVREYRLLPAQSFPLVMEPTDPGVDLVQWVNEHRDEIERKLVEHAGILFRGFDVSGIEGFEAFAEAVQPGLYGQYGDLPKKEGGKNTYRSTPYPEQKMILFHNESSHQDRWPRKQMFYCELPSPVGGATPVVDCRVMYRQLPVPLRQTLEEKGLLYVRTFTGNLDVPWQHFFKTEERSEVEARCRESGIEWSWLDDDALQIRTWCPAIISHPHTGERSFFNQVQLHHPFWLDADVREDLLALFGNDRLPRNVYYGDGSPIAESDLQLIGELYEACAVRFDWRKGDIILLDNMLVAHARDPYEGPRKIVVAMGDMVERVALAETRPRVIDPSADKETIDA